MNCLQRSGCDCRAVLYDPALDTPFAGELVVNRQRCPKAGLNRSGKSAVVCDRPDRQRRISGKTDDIPAILQNYFRKPTEVLPQRPGEFFDASLSLLLE